MITSYTLTEKKGEVGVCAPEVGAGGVTPLRDPLAPDYLDLPQSMIKCKAMIRENVHINIKKYLELKQAAEPTEGLKRVSSTRTPSWACVETADGLLDSTLLGKLWQTR